jgi:hypothetical protein
MRRLWPALININKISKGKLDTYPLHLLAVREHYNKDMIHEAARQPG